METIESFEVSGKSDRKKTLLKVREWFLRCVKEGHVPVVSILRYVGDEVTQAFVTPGCRTSINGVERWYVGSDDIKILVKILLRHAFRVESPVTTRDAPT